MLLTSLTVTDFRCHAQLLAIPIHRLTVFIGENDAGKTCLLNAIEILLTNRKVIPSDFRQIDAERVANEIGIIGEFELEAHDTLPYDFRSLDGRTLTLIKTFTESTMRCEVLGRGFSDVRFNSFNRQSASVQKEILESLDLVPEGNADRRIAQFEQAVSSGLLQKQESTLEINFNQITDHLPLYQCVSSTEYKHPDSMVQRTFQTVVESFVRPQNPETGEAELIPELSEVKAKLLTALNAKVAEIKETLYRINPKLRSVEVSPIIDFTRSVSTTNLMINTGDGPQLISSFGEGTKKKLWMGLLDWESKTQEEANISVIRVYDEPNVNLDYAAERKLFSGILDSINKEGSRTQAIISTHAITLIDRAPAQSINHIRVGEDGSRYINFLQNEPDESVQTFLTTIGRSIGVPNSALFYERAFLVVEGESEEIALSILYRHLYKRSLIEDGISLINLRSCGSWKAVLSVLSHNRAESTVVLLDQDCTVPVSSGYITPAVLIEIGYPDHFLSLNCFYIGDKEFEDSFATEDILSVLNNHWPKENGTMWTKEEVDQFRDASAKFANDLVFHVRQNCIRARRSSMRKTDFAEKIANLCCNGGRIPEKIIEVFQQVRIRSGCEEPSF